MLYNYATAMQATVSTPAWRTIDFCADWRSAPDVTRELGSGLSVRQVRVLLDALVSATFLSASDRRTDPREDAMERWTAWNPAAGFFHTTSRQVVFGDQAWFDRRLQAKAIDRPMPASVKSPARVRVPLPQARADTPLAKAVLDRRTFRQFGRARLQLGQLVELLRLTSGITHWLTIPHLGEVPLTGSPSAGARHPIETYVVAVGVEGLPRGTYRYAPDRHELDLVARNTTRAQLRAFLPRQPWFAQCGAAVFFTAVFERSAWRYEFPRAYRTVLLEAGHLCQTFLLAATSLDLAPFCTMAIDEVRVERHLRINGVDEAVLYAAGVGTRPSTATRVVLPAGRTPAHIRPNVTR